MDNIKTQYIKIVRTNTASLRVPTSGLTVHFQGPVARGAHSVT